MLAEITLSYGGIRVRICESYDSLQDAIFQWSQGRAACDCERSKYLISAGVLTEMLECSEYTNQIEVHNIQPFYVH